MIEQCHSHGNRIDRRHFLALIGVTGIGIGLVGCAPSGSPAAPSTPAASPAAAPTTAATRPAAAASAGPAPATAAAAVSSPTLTPATVHIINSRGNIPASFGALVKDQGFLKQFGLTDTTDLVGDGNAVTASIVTGAGDIGGFSNLGAVIAAVAKGAPLKIVGGSTMKAYYHVYTGRPEIKAVKDLEGKSVAISSIGALFWQIMMLLFKKHGVDPAKVELVNVGAGPDVFRAVAARKVDAGAAPIEFVPQMAANGLTTIADVWKELPDWVNTGLFTSDQTIAKRRDVLVRILAAYGKAARFLNDPGSKVQFVQAYKEVGGSEDDGAFLWQWFSDNQSWAPDIALTDKQLTFSQQSNLDLGSQEGALPLSQFADMSLARDAVKLIS